MTTLDSPLELLRSRHLPVVLPVDLISMAGRIESLCLVPPELVLPPVDAALPQRIESAAIIA